MHSNSVFKFVQQLPSKVKDKVQTNLILHINKYTYHLFLLFFSHQYISLTTCHVSNFFSLSCHHSPLSPIIVFIIHFFSFILFLICSCIFLLNFFNLNLFLLSNLSIFIDFNYFFDILNLK